MRLIVLLLSLLSLSLFASMAERSGMECPVKFEGIVDQIIEPLPPLTSRSKMDVGFQVVSKYRGQIGDYYLLKVLKYGPDKFVKGERYLVELNDGLICSIEQL